jgi:hypothetical protein
MEGIKEWEPPIRDHKGWDSRQPLADGEAPAPPQPTLLSGQDRPARVKEQDDGNYRSIWVDGARTYHGRHGSKLRVERKIKVGGY